MTSPLDLTALYRHATEALKTRDYDRAAELLQQILIQDENYRDASALLARAIRLRRRRWYQVPLLWGGVAALVLSAAAILLVPRLRSLLPARLSTATKTIHTGSAHLPTPSVLQVRPTYTATVTPVPAVWKRLNLGLDWPMDPVTAVAIDRYDADVIYAGTQSAGIYKSIDGGRSWSPAQNGLGRAPVVTLLLDAGDGQVLFAGTASGRVYRSNDGAASWVLDLEAPEQGNSWIAILLQHPADPSSLYYTPGEGIYRKVGDGAWTQVQETPCPDRIVALAAHPSDSGVVFAMASGGQCGSIVYRSKDDGRTWEATSLGGEATGGTGLWMDRVDGSALYASAGRLYRSFDQGDTWEPLPLTRCISLLIDPSDPNVALCADGDALKKTVDRGTTWRSLALPDIWLETVVGDPSEPGLLVAAGRGLFVSGDSGQTWTRRDDGLGAERFVLSIDRSDGTSLYGQSGSRLLFRSSDGGGTWTFLLNAATDAQFVSSGSALFQALTDGILRSDDHAKTWNEVNRPPELEGRYSLSVHPQDPDLLFAVHSGKYAPFVYRSEDGGETWSGTQGTSAHTDGVFFFAPSDPAVVYAAGHSPQISKSLDAGRTWLPCNGPDALPAAGGAALVVSPSDSAHLVVATQGMGIRISLDGCRSWITSGTGPASHYVNALAIDPNDPDMLYAATDGGAYVSFDSGESWGQINDGLLGATVVYSIVVDTESNVYAATPYGIFRLEAR